MKFNSYNFFEWFFKYKIKVETKAHLCFLKKVGGAVGVYMEPRGWWTKILGTTDVHHTFSSKLQLYGI
jgi:hypothetical protein